MRLNVNRMHLVLAGGAIIVIVISVIVWSLFSSPEPQSVSETEPSISKVVKPEIGQTSKLKSGTVRLPASASQFAQTDKSELEPVSSGGWIIVALAVLSVTTLISTAITFYLYRWRKILLSEPHSQVVVPEQFHGWVDGINAQIKKLTNKLGDGVEYVTRQSQDTNEKMSNLIETFMTLQNALDERDKEILRLKRGYDTEITRKFISRFIRVDQIVEDLQKAEGADVNDLKQVRRLLEDAFAECGVESFQPDLGTDYRKADGVADNPKSVKTENPEDAFKIIDVLETGYKIRTSEGSEVIIPAKVKIYIA